MLGSTPESERGVRQTFASDGDSVMLAVPGAEGEMIRTGRGHGQVQITSADFGPIQLARLQFGFPAVAEAVGTDASLILCTMLSANGGTWEGVPLEKGHTFSYGPGTSHHAADPEGLDFAMTVLPWELFERAVLDLGLDPDHAASKRTIVGGPWWSAATSLVMDDSILAATDDRHGFEERLLDTVARALCGEDLATSRQLSHRGWSDADLVAETIAFLDHSRNWLPPILTLCRHVGVSERRLYLAFKRMLDMSPRTFMMHRALQSTHVALSQGRPSVDQVAVIARSRGFAHIGRFAKYYSGVYGELPSATLNRIG